jgi:hypothetical protein
MIVLYTPRRTYFAPTEMPRSMRGALVEAPGTAPGSEELISTSFIAIAAAPPKGLK